MSGLPRPTVVLRSRRLALAMSSGFWSFAVTWALFMVVVVTPVIAAPVDALVQIVALITALIAVLFPLAVVMHLLATGTSKRLIPEAKRQILEPLLSAVLLTGSTALGGAFILGARYPQWQFPEFVGCVAAGAIAGWYIANGIRRRQERKAARAAR